MCFSTCNLKPIEFYPYPHVVEQVVFALGFCPETEEGRTIQTFERSLVREFNKKGIEAMIDNKVVFQCEIHGKMIYYGFKDWRFSVGFVCRKMR